MRRIALLLGLLLALPAALAAPDGDPNATDPDDDAGHDSMDLQKLWLAANATHLQVALQVKALPEPPADQSACPDGCASATVSFRVEFRVERDDGAPAPAQAGYNTSYVVYRHGAEDPALRAQMGWIDDEDVLAFDGAPTVTVDGNVVLFSVPRDHAILNMPETTATGYRVTRAFAYDSPQACQTQSELPAVPTYGTVLSPCSGVPRPTQAGFAPDGWDRMPDAGYAADLLLPALAAAVAQAPPPPAETQAPPTSEPAPAPAAEEPARTTPAATTPAPGPASPAVAPKDSPAAPLWLVLAGLAAQASLKRRTVSSSKASRSEMATSML
ncbi:MAG: hypothetical protein QOD77_1341 [Thermoplasmata archaeon]|jgi:hypothetical protein|nr:hypothetical protein [Thermoplasmata archaeon]